MFSSWNKRSSKAIFTVHILKPGIDTVDAFCIEWERGGHKGLTEEGFIAESKEIVFEKSFKCPVTMYIDKSNDKLKSKTIKFTVYRRGNGTKPKIFGKFKIDISQFYNSSTASIIKCSVDSPRSKEAEVMLSILVTPNPKHEGSDQSVTDSDMVSISEKPASSAENMGEWDFSSSYTTEDKEKFADLLAQKHSLTDENTVSLSSMIGTTPARRSRIKKDRISKSQVFSEDQILSVKNSLLLSPGNDKKKVPSSMFFERKKFDPNEQVQSISNENENDYEKPNLTFGIHDPQSAIGFLDSVLSKHWSSSPLNYQEYPLAATAVIASLLHIQIFQNFNNENDFKEIISRFFEYFSKYKIIENSTELDRVYTTLCIVSSFRHLKIESERIELIITQFLSCARASFSSILKKLCSPFDKLVMPILQSHSDPDVIASTFVKSMNAIIKQIFDSLFFFNLFDNGIHTLNKC